MGHALIGILQLTTPLLNGYRTPSTERSSAVEADWKRLTHGIICSNFPQVCQEGVWISSDLFHWAFQVQLARGSCRACVFNFGVCLGFICWDVNSHWGSEQFFGGSAIPRVYLPIVSASSLVVFWQRGLWNFFSRDQRKTNIGFYVAIALVKAELPDQGSYVGTARGR